MFVLINFSLVVRRRRLSDKWQRCDNATYTIVRQNDIR